MPQLDCNGARRDLELTRTHFDSFKKYYEEYLRTGGMEAGELMVFFMQETEFSANRIYEHLEAIEKIALKLRDKIAKKHGAEYVSEFVENRARMEIAGVWSFVDRSGEIISDGFTKLRNYSDGRAWAYIDSNTVMLLDESGAPVNSHTYRFLYLQDFHDGYATVSTHDGEIHILDKQGETYSKLDGASPTKFNSQRAAIRNPRGNFVYINIHGQELFDQEFQSANEFEDGLARVVKGGKIFFIDPDGKDVLGPFGVSNGFKDGVAWVKRENEVNWTLIDKKGNILRQEPFAEVDKIKSFSDGIGMAYQGNHYIFIDQQGKRVGSQAFQKIHEYSERVVLTEHAITKRKTFFNMNGKDFELESTWEPRKFNNGMCAIKRGESDWIFINRDMVVMKGGPFESIRDFDKWGVGKIKTEGKWHYVDRDGNILFENETPS